MRRIKLYGITKSYNSLNNFDLSVADIIQLRDKSLVGSTQNRVFYDKVRDLHPTTPIVLNYFNYSQCDQGLVIDGIQYQISNINKRDIAREYDFLSTHCEDDLKMAMEMGIEYVTLSSIFPTQSHPEESRLLGLERYFQLVDRYPKLRIFGLGGISKDRLKLFGNSYGVAGISLFAKD